ncbi:CLUMA_CG012702, isoform A [Clunio marinus]|uniref:CLUMA_CG012702, isoform A n=1 Tax=Clunio marinus TaxID=568069 RepID=A0A1J1ILJ3_9DIPT|nr:CLUMA_CG012702, isoform A [Clunio marinus]
MMTWLLAIALSIVVPASSDETIAQNDFRFISYHDLLATSSRFAEHNVTTFSRLLFDVSRNSLIVGARKVSTQLEIYFHFSC